MPPTNPFFPIYYIGNSLGEQRKKGIDYNEPHNWALYIKEEKTSPGKKKVNSLLPQFKKLYNVAIIKRFIGDELA